MIMNNDKNRKITAQEADRLFSFTREHFVEHYDLQSELVDHLANAIELKWQQNTDLDFEQALQAAFKKFGIFGFSDIVEKRQKALTKKYYKLLWGYFKNFFRLPQVIGTISAVIATYWLLKFSSILYMVFLLCGIVTGVSYAIYMSVKYRRRAKKTGRKWLLEEIIYSCAGGFPVVYAPIYFQHFFSLEENTMSEPATWLLAVTLVLYYLFDYVALFVLPRKAKKHLTELYPEYHIVENQ